MVKTFEKRKKKTCLKRCLLRCLNYTAKVKSDNNLFFHFVQKHRKLRAKNLFSTFLEVPMDT